MPTTDRPLDEMLPPDEQARVVSAIGEAEARTSGEIRVHLEARMPEEAKGDAIARARALFPLLGLTETVARNGVLIYVAIDDHRFAIWGDEGIHGAVGEGFWQDAAARMRERFVRGAIGEGLVAAIEAVGAKLAERFPPLSDDVNELPDTISHGRSPGAASGSGPGAGDGHKERR